MFKIQSIAANQPALQDFKWPHVPPFEALSRDFNDYLAMDSSAQRLYWRNLRTDPCYENRLHDFLSIVSAYLFSYFDSPVYLTVDDDFEIALQRAKINLEREVTRYWLRVDSVPTFNDQNAAADHLTRLVDDNAGVNHALFDYLEANASREAFHIFLRNEVCRNEVVDDEVALMSVGIQGRMKAAVCSNLWDEVGHGTLRQFHTYWLRELLHSMDDWENLLRYRRLEKPWFTMITTNVFNILLSRPGLKFRRYGWFLLNEGWVESHFKKILTGMERVGLNDETTRRYFSAHVSIDPRHTRELVEAFRHQSPRLTPAQTNEVVKGAYISLAASLSQYDLMLGYIRDITDGKIKCVSLAA